MDASACFRTEAYCYERGSDRTPKTISAQASGAVLANAALVALASDNIGARHC